MFTNKHPPRSAPPAPPPPPSPVQAANALGRVVEATSHPVSLGWHRVGGVLGATAVVSPHFITVGVQVQALARLAAAPATRPPGTTYLVH